ncbi:MAG: hypothetical protein OXC94_05530 [Chloroflexi bacterium]|nr:hypothetical protein [Chloroflexota bacterium]
MRSYAVERRAAIAGAASVTFVTPDEPGALTIGWRPSGNREC